MFDITFTSNDWDRQYIRADDVAISVTMIYRGGNRRNMQMGVQWRRVWIERRWEHV